MMKTKRIQLIPFFIALSLIFALNMPALSVSAEQTATPSSATITAAPSIEKDAVAFIDPYIDEAIALIEADRRQQSGVTFDYEPKPLYDGLSREGKSMYDEMLRNAQHLIPFSYTAKQHGYEGMDMALVVYGAIKTDHPEIENYFMLRDVMEGDMTAALEALYFMPWDAKQRPADATMLREEMLRFDVVCARIAERMPDEFSAYDKYRYLASVISLITSYDYDGVGGWQVGTAYGSILGGHSVCQGYSRGFLHLCQKANLWCETVDGVSGGNVGHMWNMVKLDSGTYHLDITWSDELGLPDSLGWSRYFMLTQDEILVDHEITDGKVATGTTIK
ncbi:MAG: transglutaminase domain-containing protein [Christensenellales bacterium]